MPEEISPLIIGIMGRGIVSEGAIELLKEAFQSEEIDAKDL